MEHFVKPSYGKIYHFCHTKHGICVGNRNNSEYQVILPDGEEDFDVTIDNTDGIHLVCQNKNGDIIYITQNGENWEQQILMQSRSRKSSRKNFSIQRAGNILNVIYLLEQKGNYVIAHQMIGNKQTPDVLDYTNGEFSVAKDNCNNIYLLYYSVMHKAVGYIIYTWSKKEWSDFTPLNIEGNIKQMHIFVDKCDNIHITGCLDGEIIYYQGEIQTFGEGKNPILMEKDALYLLWEDSESQKICAASSMDCGKTFSITTEFMAGRFSASKIYAVSYTIYESSCNANRCYGYTSDGTVKFYLASDFFNISRVPPKPKENFISDEIQKFRQKLTGGGQPDKSIAIMLDKISVKLDVLLNEIQNLKNSQNNL